MNKPVLIIDEAPFVKHIRRSDDLDKFLELKFRLNHKALENNVEFFYDEGLERGGIPRDVNSKDFTDLFSNRKFIFGHNSIPDSGSGEVPLLDDSFFSVLQEYTDEGCVMVKFSGSRKGKFSYQTRLKDIDFSWDNPLNYKEIQVGRHEVYANLDRFVLHLTRNGYQYPVYEFLTKGLWSLEDIGKEYFKKNAEFLFEEVKSISGLLGKKQNTQPKGNWKDLIGRGPLPFYLSLFAEDQVWRNRVMARLEEKKPYYSNPSEYLGDLEMLLTKLKNQK
jgi:hypothetical protein